MAFKINTRLAKSISYEIGKRDLLAVLNIVIHYTGNKGDTAKNNADYFATGNTRKAGAHFFVDKNGEIWKSVNMNRIARAVGGVYSLHNGAGTYYNKCNNSNSVSIELCDCINDINWEQKLAVRKLIRYIQKKCPNAKTVIRHWDVNGKPCPASMTGENNVKWIRLHDFITKGCSFDARVTKNAVIRSTPGVKVGNKLRTVKKGTKVHIMELRGNWGRLKKTFGNEKEQWITLDKVKEI